MSQLPRHSIPTGLQENLVWRNRMRKKSGTSKSLRRELSKACSEDLLFFANGFLWTYDPKRHPDSPDRPFIAWPFQVPILDEMQECVGRRDLVLIKSRDVGGSLMPLIVQLHRLLFRPGQAMGVMSRNMDLVASPDDPDSLFYKLDYMIRWMPEWVRAGIARKVGPPPSLVNEGLQSRVIGAATTRDANRGGRKQNLLIDEFAAFDRAMSFEVFSATQHASRARFFVSTPKGVGNGFHKITTEGSRKILRVHWSDHPVHGAGLYTSDGDELRLLDRPYWEAATRDSVLHAWPELDTAWAAGKDYPYILDGKLRSPYYDQECLRCPIPSLIKQELDMDFVGSGAPFYDSDGIRSYVQAVCCPPYAVGELDGGEFKRAAGGRLALWLQLDARGRPPRDRRYCFAADISQGTGYSNSVLSIGDMGTRSKVGTFVSPYVGPHNFAGICAEIIDWFGGGPFIFDGAGPGQPFGVRCKELGLQNMHKHRSPSRKGGEAVLGWFPEDRDARRRLLASYGDAIVGRHMTNPDRLAVEECMQYEFTTADKIEHVGSKNQIDPSGASNNHGDRVIADALLWKRLSKEPPPQPKKMTQSAYVEALIREHEAEMEPEFW